MKNNFSNTVKELCFSIYPKKIVADLWLPNDKKNFYRYLATNRLIHLLKDHENEYKAYKAQVNSSVQLLDQIIGKKNYLLIKTISSYPHITSDIDVLVKTEKIAMKTQKELGKKEPFSLLIDVNHLISWTESEEISSSFTWKNTTTYRDTEIEVLVPNNELDTLIRIGHIPFELAEIRLGELMHIFNAAQSIDWNILQQEATKMNWPRTFQFIKNTLNLIHVQLFQEDFFTKQPTENQHSSLIFPSRISYWHLALAMIEKKAWKKMWGARYVLLDRSPMIIQKIFR